MRLALCMGMSVKRLLREFDSEELAEWAAFDRRWPLPDAWGQTARICRIIMAASGSYRKNDIPDESAFIPSVIRPEQSNIQMVAELQKLLPPDVPIQG
jgi:hypothetical protein